MLVFAGSEVFNVLEKPLLRSTNMMHLRICVCENEIDVRCLEIEYLVGW